MESIDEVNPVLIFLFYFCLDYPLPYFVKWLQCTGLHFCLTLCFGGLPSNFKSGYIVVPVSINCTVNFEVIAIAFVIVSEIIDAGIYFNKALLLPHQNLWLAITGRADNNNNTTRPPRYRHNGFMETGVCGHTHVQLHATGIWKCKYCAIYHVSTFWILKSQHYVKVRGLLSTPIAIKVGQQWLGAHAVLLFCAQLLGGVKLYFLKVFTPINM